MGRPPTFRSPRPAATFPGAGSRAPGTFEEFPFTIGPNDENAKFDVSISWASANNDFDLFVYKVEENGDQTEVASSASAGAPATRRRRPSKIPAPVTTSSWSTTTPRADPADFTGTIDFTGAAAGVDAGTGTYTVAEKDAWLRRSSSTFAPAATWCSLTARCARCPV